MDADKNAEYTWREMINKMSTLHDDLVNTTDIFESLLIELNEKIRPDFNKEIAKMKEACENAPLSDSQVCVQAIRKQLEDYEKKRAIVLPLLKQIQEKFDCAALM